MDARELNKKYDETLSSLECAQKKVKVLKEEALSTIMPIGKYKGKSIKDIMAFDKQYIDWAIRKQIIRIDARLLGYTYPTSKEEILRTLGVTYDGEKFTRKISIKDPGLYDNWNIGHYGCTEPKCIRPASTKVITTKYTWKEFMSSFKNKLVEIWPQIEWTEEYIKSILNEAIK